MGNPFNVDEPTMSMRDIGSAYSLHSWQEAPWYVAQLYPGAYKGEWDKPILSLSETMELENHFGIQFIHTPEIIFFESFPIQLIYYANKVWFSINDICDIAGAKSIQNAKARVSINNKIHRSIFARGLGGFIVKMHFVNEEGLLMALGRAKTLPSSKKQRLLEFLQQAGLFEGYTIQTVGDSVPMSALSNSSSIILCAREEVDFIQLLEDALSVMGIYGQSQYFCNGYKIDYYIPKMRIAIEYDENSHKYYDLDEEDIRQIEISNLLNCIFIRVTNRKSTGWNIGYVISKLFDLPSCI